MFLSFVCPSTIFNTLAKGVARKLHGMQLLKSMSAAGTTDAARAHTPYSSPSFRIDPTRSHAFATSSVIIGALQRTFIYGERRVDAR